HLRAIGAFKVVKINNGDLGLRIAAHRTAVSRDQLGRVFADIPFRETRERVAVPGKEETQRLLFCGIGSRGKCNRHSIKSSNVARAAGAYFNLPVLRDTKLRAHKNLDAAVDFRADRSSILRLTSGC